MTHNKYTRNYQQNENLCDNLSKKECIGDNKLNCILIHTLKIFLDENYFTYCGNVYVNLDFME
jgi:hypothetical protein